MSDSSVTRFLPPRDASGPVSCSVCGCRLIALSGAEDGLYRHFPSMLPHQDARGCRPACVEALHGRDGRRHQRRSRGDRRRLTRAGGRVMADPMLEIVLIFAMLVGAAAIAAWWRGPEIPS
jgi:hypothetical protein